jgi:hypothetical protein
MDMNEEQKLRPGAVVGEPTVTITPQDIDEPDPAGSPDDLKELKEALVFAFDIQDGVNNSLEDGEVSAKDALNFWPAAKSAPAAFKNLGNPLARYNRLNAEQKAELLAYAKVRFNLLDDRAEAIVLKALTIAQLSVELAGHIREYRQAA